MCCAESLFIMIYMYVWGYTLLSLPPLQQSLTYMIYLLIEFNSANLFRTFVESFEKNSTKNKGSIWCLLIDLAALKHIRFEFRWEIIGILRNRNKKQHRFTLCSLHLYHPKTPLFGRYTECYV
jgi:hypothetical protein